MTRESGGRLSYTFGGRIDMTKYLRYALGLIILLACIYLGWAWGNYFANPKYDTAMYVFGLAGILFLTSIFLGFIIWTGNRKRRNLRMYINTFVILLPFVTTFLGCNGGWAWATYVRGNDYPLIEFVLGSAIGLGIGVIAAIYINKITSSDNKDQDNSTAVENKNR